MNVRSGLATSPDRLREKPAALAPEISFHLERLAALKQTGSLVIVRPAATSMLVFARGRIALAKGGFPEARLGRVLLEQRALTEVELVQALSAQQADRCQTPLGRLLVDSGRVEGRAVEKALELQCFRVVGAVLSLSPARYHWLAGSWGDFSGHRQKLVTLGVEVSEAIRHFSGGENKS